MINANKQTTSQSKTSLPGIQRNYNEVVEFLDAHWSPSRSDKELVAIKKLDNALGSPSKAVPAIFIGGTNGKGLTINFAAQLFKEEGLKVGAFYSPHILTYNERFVINNESISNKTFTDLANEIINTAETLNIKADTLDILTMMALRYFQQSDVDVALLELSIGTSADPLTICQPKVLAITRITDKADVADVTSENMKAFIKEILQAVRKETHVVSADQSKSNLQLMLEETEQRNGTWAMPIRKLAQLEYPYEQLHGRCAALAGRICEIYINNFTNATALIAENKLLAKQKRKRGRPTIKAKQQAEENPEKTIGQFWKETITSLPAHFQILDKEKPTILLDNARNIDALLNLLLGVRLLHYQRPQKGLTFIFGCDKNQMNTEEFLRLLRYFSKKNSANFIFCPINNNVPGLPEESWDVEQITNDVRSLKIKAKSAQNFAEAFESAKKMVDERHGLVVIAGSQSIITEYWRHKGLKKL